MKILMYGWEFPPLNQGGLGVACHGIVKGLVKNGLKVNLVLPTAEPIESQGFDVTDASISKNIKTIKVPSALKAYQDTQSYKHYLESLKDKAKYSPNLFAEVENYKQRAGKLAEDIEHDVIHAHDWLTYPAAVEAKKISNKPLIAHIHATEIDRSGDNPNPHIFEIERMGFEAADKIVAVSHYTKQKIVEHYNIPASKIVVVHNAISKDFERIQHDRFCEGQKKVLFLGRITMQKGPEYFLHAAKKVLEVEPDTLFIMAGDGDMMARMIHLAIELDIQENVIFTGFLRGADIDRAFQNADLLVMPSVSEPFGLVALEAIHNGTPVLVSKQSGVTEVVPNCLRADFWDIHELANKIAAGLRYEPMMSDLRHLGGLDLEKVTWEQQTAKLKDLYHSLA